MSDIVCRRAGCTNILSERDAEQNYEHCSPECYEANDDLDKPELADKQLRHERTMVKRGKKKKRA